MICHSFTNHGKLFERKQFINYGELRWIPVIPVNLIPVMLPKFDLRKFSIFVQFQYNSGEFLL